jgi:hypothetical protein
MSKTLMDPETGQPMVRGTRPVTITFGGFSETVAMPGWYSEAGEGVHSGEDLAVSDEALARLKKRASSEAGEGIATEKGRRVRPAG